MPLRKKTRAGRRKQTAVVLPDGIARYLNPFLEWSAYTGTSPRTVYKRETALKRFIVWCDERELKAPQSITKPILERYQKYLFYYRQAANGKPLTFGTQVSLLVPVRTFFKWLTQHNHILYNPASELNLPRRARQLPRVVLSIEEIETILQQPDICTPQGMRDRALMETLYSTGIRRMEIVNLKIYEVDRARRIVLIREGKGQKDRYVPIGERALLWIEKYLDEVRPLLVTHSDDGTLFLNDFGEPFELGNLGYHVKKYFNLADLNVIGSCHLFRHAMATHMLENGADVRFVQAILGHSNLSTTQIYTHVAINTLQDVHSATHPAKLNRDNNNHSEDIDTLMQLLNDEEEDDIDAVAAADAQAT